eukprot:TRINITY_DN22470_c0_g1_i1.p1 TRINITY_DN22470_c0_g1~~TRINITY_DN22470_c0_g1_i1.p1  ORF type:complete len:140 (+),score=23.90 TRINITY_DN22470_c0_g1_i1:50-469(+)
MTSSQYSAQSLAELLDADDSDLFSELPEDEFQRLLASYPVVRDKNFQATPSSVKPLSDAPVQRRAAVAAQKSTASSSSTKSDTDFWPSLRSFLLKYYPATEADRVLQCFKEAHQNYVKQLSLQNVEQLASKMAAELEPD